MFGAIDRYPVPLLTARQGSFISLIFLPQSLSDPYRLNTQLSLNNGSNNESPANIASHLHRA